MNGVPVAIDRPGLSLHADRQSALLRARLDLRHPEEELQKLVDEVRGKGAQVVVLLSHNGMDVDLKLASRVRGIDAILGGHTHDGVPQPSLGRQRRRQDAGHQRRLQRQVPRRARPRREGRRASPASATSCCRCSPTCCRRTPSMAALIDGMRAPYEAKLDEKLAVTEGLLYRRGNFNGTFDQLILDALMAEKDAEIAFSPGLPLGHDAAARARRSRFEQLMDQTAITYPYVT